MADQNTVICAPDNCKIKIIKWRVREGFPVGCAQVILMYQICDTDDKEIKKLRACNAGVVKKRLFKEGATVEKGCALVSLSTCIHTTVVKDMCADCGADLRQDEKGNTPEASVPMVHSIPDLKVSEKLAQKLGRADTKRLLQDKKLVLLVDLDQTIIHTTNDNVPNNIKGIYHFQLYGPHSRWYHTRLRPGTRNFLEQMSQYYELHICTFGARNYAHTIAQLLDPDGKFFSHRILSRDECFNATSKTDNLKALFPCGDSMVCIIDDREDVWNMASNLIQVKPYHFFQHTGDINAPPEVSKHELDGEGIDFKDLQKLSGSEEIFFKKLDGNKEGYAINETKAAAKEESKKKSEDKEATKDPTTTASIPDGNTQNSDSDKKEDDSVIEPPAKIRKEDEPQTKTLKENESPAKINNENESSATIRKENELPTKTSKANELQIKLSKENEPSTKNSIGNETSKDDPPKSKITSENPGKLIDIEDPDDYLLYLESILINIHSRFYEIYNKINEIPDLKIIVPKIRSEVLRKKNLVFSGLVPTNMKLEQSRAYFIAKSLGAEVSQNINEHTTHLVAVTSGTFKVNAARKNPKIKIVNANWLWSCAERWENVDERMFPLDKKNNNQQRQPPAHCHSPEHVVNYSEKSEISSSSSMQELEPEKFIDTINPLLSFSNADLADMNKEFDQFFESDSSSEDEHRNFENPPEDKVLRKRKRQEKEEERQRKFFSPDEEITFEKKDATENEENSSVEEEDDEMPSTKFRRGEHLPSDLEMGSGSDDNSETRDVEDDGDWNMMGAALEREFLGLED